MKSEVEGVRVVYEMSKLENVITYEGRRSCRIRGDTEIHWGPIVSKYADIRLSGDARRTWYPRKIAGTGYVVYNKDWKGPGDPDKRDEIGKAGIPPDYGYSQNSSPDTIGNLELAEWRSNLPDLPEVNFDLNFYKKRAKNYILPADMIKTEFDKKLGRYKPTKCSRIEYDSKEIDHYHVDGKPTGYFRKIGGGEGTVKFKKGFVDMTCSTITYYVDSTDGKIKVEKEEGTFTFIGPPDGTIRNNEVAFICIGNLKMGGKGWWWSRWDWWKGKKVTGYKVRIPPDAEKEYKNGTVRNWRKGDTAAKDEYPGDVGLDAAEFFEFKEGQKIWEELDNTWSEYEHVNFCGFLYVQGTLEVKGEEIFVGCMFIEGDLTKSGLGKRAKFFYKHRCRSIH